LDNVKKNTPLLGNVIDALINYKILITTRMGGHFLDLQQSVGYLSLARGWSVEEKSMFATGLKSVAGLEELLKLPYPLGIKMAVERVREGRETNPDYTFASHLTAIREGREEPIGQKAIVREAVASVPSTAGQTLLQLLSQLSLAPIPFLFVREIWDRYFHRQSPSERQQMLSVGIRELQRRLLIDIRIDQGTTQEIEIYHELIQEVITELPKANQGLIGWFRGDKSVQDILCEIMSERIRQFNSRKIGEEWYRNYLWLLLPHVENFFKAGFIYQGKQHGPDDIFLAARLVNIGNSYGVLGDSAKQIGYQERALAIKEAHYKGEHIELAGTLNNLGSAYGDMGDSAKQIKYQERALAIQKAHYKGEHIELAITIFNLGRAYLAQKKTKQAKSHFSKAHRIFKAHYGPEHQLSKMVGDAVQKADSGNNCAAANSEQPESSFNR